MSEDWDDDPPSEFHPVESGTRFTGPTYDNKPKDADDSNTRNFRTTRSGKSHQTTDDKWGSGDNNNNGNRGNVERSSSGRDFRDVKWESGDNNYANNGYRRNVEWGTNVKERRVGRGRQGFGRDVDSRHKPNNINNRWGENHQEGALGDRGDNKWESGDNNNGNKENIEWGTSGNGRGNRRGRSRGGGNRFNNDETWVENGEEGSKGRRGDMWENGDNNKGNRGNVERNSSGTDRRGGRGRCFDRDVDSRHKFNNINKELGENDQEGERGEREGKIVLITY